MNQETVLTLWDQLQSQMTAREFYQTLQLPRSTFYRWLRKAEKKLDDQEEQIRNICRRHHQRYGYRKVTAALKRMGIRINHKKVLRIMKTYNLLSKVRRKKKVYYGGTEVIVAPNLVARNFEATAPNQKWFTDMTYLIFGERTLYLSTILDAYNRQVVSYSISESPNVQLALDTLKQAVEHRDVKGVILHSDQGSVYTSREFQMYIKEKGITMSMSRKGNCHDNAVMESFFAILKSEAFHSQGITKVSNTTVRKIVLEYIHYYNCVRIQEKLNYLSPVEYEEQAV